MPIILANSSTYDLWKISSTVLIVDLFFLFDHLSEDGMLSKVLSQFPQKTLVLFKVTSRAWYTLFYLFWFLFLVLLFFLFFSSSFYFCYSDFSCFSLHCFSHSSRYLIIFTFSVLQSILGLWQASHSISKIIFHFCPPITSISVLSLYLW